MTQNEVKIHLPQTRTFTGTSLYVSVISKDVPICTTAHSTDGTISSVSWWMDDIMTEPFTPFSKTCTQFPRTLTLPVLTCMTSVPLDCPTPWKWFTNSLYNPLTYSRVWMVLLCSLCSEWVSKHGKWIRLMSHLKPVRKKGEWVFFRKHTNASMETWFIQWICSLKYVLNDTFNLFTYTINDLTCLSWSSCRLHPPVKQIQNEKR